MSEALIPFSELRKGLQQAKSFDDFKRVSDHAELMRRYLKRANESIEMQNDAAEIGLTAKRRAGEMLKEGDRAKAGDNQYTRSGTTTVVVPPSLSEIGITANQSSRWQSIAEIPEERFEQIIQEYKQERKEITTAAILRMATELRREHSEERRAERVAKVVEIANASIDPLTGVGQFPILYVDPPWRYDFSKDDADQIESHYPTMTTEEICALPVQEISLADCVLFLWATSPKLEEAFTVLNAWGFTYRTCAVWDKQWIGPGYYFRQRHELLLVATKGAIPVPLPANRPDSVFTEKRTAHSKKPEIAYQLIEQMYPDLPRLELFSRVPRESWAAWGNEVKKEVA